MGVFGNEMKKYLDQTALEKGNEVKIAETVCKSKQAFCENEMEHQLSYPEFIYQQSGCIRKRWWILQGMLLFVLWQILRVTDSNFYIQRIMGIFAPLFVILIIPEFWKNKNNAAMEIECASYYSLRQVYAARLILFAIVDILLLSLFFIMAAASLKLTISDIVIQFMIPFNVSGCICLRTLCSKKNVSEYAALFLCAVWITVWLQIVLNEGIYNTISGPVWSAMIITSVLYLGSSILKLQKSCEEIWEVNSSWN